LPTTPSNLVVLSGPPAFTVRDQAAASVLKYARSRLDAGTRERIVRKLEAALATKTLCCDSLLNLRSLSRSINEKAHYVSQVINQDLNVNFYELVNRHRIEQAKGLLARAPDQTVLEIALAVGFNSKSTFNTAFRQNTGMTPREYRAQHLERR
jgi:AraC-like DNA-binding protein